MTGISCSRRRTRPASRSLRIRCMCIGCTTPTRFRRSRWPVGWKAIGCWTDSSRGFPCIRGSTRTDRERLRGFARESAAWRLPVNAVGGPRVNRGEATQRARLPSPLPATRPVLAAAAAATRIAMGHSRPRSSTIVADVTCAFAARRDLAAATAACAALLRRVARRPARARARRCMRDGGRPAAGSGALAAVRGPRARSGSTATPTTAFRIWTALNSAFVDALSGQDAHAANARSQAYRSWSKRRPPSEHAQDIAVVLLLPGDTTADAVMPTLQSIATQTPADRPSSSSWHWPRACARCAARARRSASFRCALGRGAGELQGGRAERWRCRQSGALDRCRRAPPHVRSRSSARVDRGSRGRRRAVGLHRLHACSGGCGRRSTAGRNADLARRDAHVVGEGGKRGSRVHRSSLSGRRRRCRRVLALPARCAGWFSTVGRPRALGSRRFARRSSTSPSTSTGELPTCGCRGRTTANASRAGSCPACDVPRVLRDAPVRMPRPDPNPYAPSLFRWGFAFLRRVFGSGHVLMLDVDYARQAVRRGSGACDRLATSGAYARHQPDRVRVRRVRARRESARARPGVRNRAHPVRRERHRHPAQYAAVRPAHEVASCCGRSP